MNSLVTIRWQVIFLTYTSMPTRGRAKLSLACHMMTSSIGNILRVTGPLCGEFPTQKPVTRSSDVFFDLRLNKRLSKQSQSWWFETPSCSLWRPCNDIWISAKNKCRNRNCLGGSISQVISKYPIFLLTFWYLTKISIIFKTIFFNRPLNENVWILNKI